MARDKHVMGQLSCRRNTRGTMNNFTGTKTKMTKTTTMHGGTSARNITRTSLTARSTEFLLGLGRCRN
ncbi:hypothetical protein M0804_010239 [Polistes exclamans]|nr:hypothetical protein M0804_010239 [Polistes exclamans]